MPCAGNRDDPERHPSAEQPAQTTATAAPHNLIDLQAWRCLVGVFRLSASEARHVDIALAREWGLVSPWLCRGGELTDLSQQGQRNGPEDWPEKAGQVGSKGLSE